MRSLGNLLSDPTLHLLMIALFLIYLAFGNSQRARDGFAESPLPVCKTCHIHFLPDRPCDCRTPGRFAQATH